MKTFLQSAIDCFNQQSLKFSICHCIITDNKQWKITKTYLYSNSNEFAFALSQEESVYFLLFIAAERGEL